MRSLTALLSLLAACGSASAAEQGATDKPNIVYILVDDMGYADVGFNGCKDIRTPNIDKLAKQGAVLECLYGQPVCSPTRAALLTGRYLTRTGIYNVVNPGGKNLRGPLPLTERTLAQQLRRAGYFTALVGKWHLGADSAEYMPTKRGFDRQYGYMGGTINSFTHTAGAGDGPPDWYRNDAASKEVGYSTHLLAREACRIIREKPAEKPLFLYFATNAVHGPLLSPEEYKAPYDKLPKNRKELAGMTAAMDEAVGQIVATLEEKGLSKNTLILFSSDNGGPSWNKTSSNSPLRGGKSDIYEGGMRLCAFATWPGRIPAGVRIAEPIHVVDWFPTLSKLAGAEPDPKLNLDGRDVWPVLTRKAKSPHDAILLVGARNGEYAIRVGDWKLLINPREYKTNVKSLPVELYNLAEDIGESKNLAAEEPERVRALRARLDAMIAGPVHPQFFKSKSAQDGQGN